jgi:hypothetical protein
VEQRLDEIVLPVPPTSPADALAVAVASARRMECAELRAALEAELEALQPYQDAATRANAAANEVIESMDAVKNLGRAARLCACYALPPAEEVQHVLPRAGTQAIASIAGRIAEMAPRLEEQIRAVLERLEGNDARA